MKLEVDSSALEPGQVVLIVVGDFEPSEDQKRAAVASALASGKHHVVLRRPAR